MAAILCVPYINVPRKALLGIREQKLDVILLCQVLNITTAEGGDAEVAEAMVRKLSPHMIKTYHLAGNQRFELPANEVMHCSTPEICL